MLNRDLVVIFLMVVSLFTLGACKNYPPEIEKACDEACTEGCAKSCELDSDFKSYEKGTCRSSCKFGCNMGCKKNYLADIPDYDSSIVQGENKTLCENGCKEECEKGCREDNVDASELPICVHTCIPGCTYVCVRELLKQE